MAAQIVFKVKLRAHGEVSPAFIQRLRVIQQYIDNLFGPPNAAVRDEADVRYEQIQANGIDRTEGWDLTCRQPDFVDDAEFSCGQPDDFSRGGTEAGTEVLTATCQGDPSVELPPGMFEPQFDPFLLLHDPSSIFSGQSAQGSPTNRYNHEYATGGDSVAEPCTKSANASGNKEYKWKAYSPNAPDTGSVQDARAPKRRKQKRSIGEA